MSRGEGCGEGLGQVVEVVSRAGGHPVVLAVGDDDASVAQLEALFTEQREAEWVEFLEDCAKFESELAGKVAKAKLMLAELDEE